MAPSRRTFPVTARGKDAAALALHRFGFGPTRDSIVAIAGDPRGALLSDIDRPGAGFLASALPSSSRAAREVSDFRAEEQAKKKLALRAQKSAEAETALANFDCRKAPTAAPRAAPPAQNDAANQPRPPTPQPPLPQRILENEAAARYQAAIGADMASSNGWAGSGRTIFAFRRTRTSRWSAPTSARRSVRTFSGVSATCWQRSRAIRPCCSISITSSRWAPTRSTGSTATR